MNQVASLRLRLIIVPVWIGISMAFEDKVASFSIHASFFIIFYSYSYSYFCPTRMHLARLLLWISF